MKVMIMDDLTTMVIKDLCKAEKILADNFKLLSSISGIEMLELNPLFNNVIDGINDIKRSVNEEINKSRAG